MHACTQTGGSLWLCWCLVPTHNTVHTADPLSFQIKGSSSSSSSSVAACPPAWGRRKSSAPAPWAGGRVAPAARQGMGGTSWLDKGEVHCNLWS